MTTLERKRKLKKQIDFSDEETLDKIEKILNEGKIKFPQFIINEIENSREQYKKGEYLTEGEAEKDFEEWLKEE